MNILNFKRKKFIVDRRFQFSYMAFNLIFLVVFSLVAAGGVYFGIWKSVTKEFSAVELKEDLDSIKRIREYDMVRRTESVTPIPFLEEEAKMLSEHQKQLLNSIISNTNLRLIPVLVFLAVFAILGSLILSHRIAGPVYSIKKKLLQIKNGDLTVRFSLRRKDQLRDLALEIEEMIKHFEKYIKQVKEGLAKTEKMRDEKEIKYNLKNIITKLEIFKTGKDE